MATKTPNLGLIKPGQGEYENNWDVPLNKNADLIDGFLSDVISEVQGARGTKATLTQRIDVALNADGTFRDFPEIVEARNSPIYGSVSGVDAATLGSRIENGEFELFYARQGAGSLVGGIAGVSGDVASDCVVSAPTGFLTFTGSSVKLDGSTQPIVLNINGYRQVIRKLVSVTASGAAGTQYVYVTRNAAGHTYLDRSGTGQNNGGVGTDATTGRLCKFTDTSQDFISAGVAAGDILEITTASSTNAGRYVVDSVAGPNTLLVKGVFSTTQLNLGYKLTDPLAPSVSVSADSHAKRFAPASGKICVGRVIFDGTNVIDATAYSVNAKFEQTVPITLASGAFNQTIAHKIGYIPSRVLIYASQTSDLSLPLENADVVFKVDDTNISIRNSVTGVFHQSFDGLSYTSGFLVVIVER